MNAIDLSGRRAVVTGGAQGIGLAVVERFRQSGAAVAIWDRDRALMERTLASLPDGPPVAGFPVDVTEHAAVADALEKTEAALGPVDILIANAGIAGPNATTWDYDVAAWHHVVAVDLFGVYHCCRAVAPGMQARGYGRIVNVASIAGKEGNPNASAYSAAKAGVIALTKSLGKELAGHDIAVNCVTPAAARTAIFDQMSQTHIDYMLSRIPRGRFLDVQEAAAMIAWLASAENSFTTGAVFDLSGGRATY